MAITDIFKRKPSNNTQESNTLFGQTALGNNILRNVKGQNQQSNNQLLYVTTSSVNTAGRVVDMSVLSRNSTVMACVNAKARALAQLPIKIMAYDENGKLVDAVTNSSVSARDKAKAKAVYGLLNSPNHYQSAYEFWYQWSMWYDLSGETFTALWRKEQTNPTLTPMEMYLLDSTLITAQITPTRYPTYRLSTSTYGFNKDEPLDYFQVIHASEMAWQGSAGFNKGILATELVSLDQDIDLYSNFIMLNGAKPSGMFVTDQVIPDAKFKEIAARLKEAWSSLTGSSSTDQSKPGQGMLLDNGMRYEKLEMLTLQDADARALKQQTMKRICGLFGVPPAMIGIEEGKYNNTQTMLDEFYKSTMLPMITNIQQKFKTSLLAGYPNLCIEFQTQDFLKGAPLDQMNYAVAGVNAGIITPNEAREYLGKEMLDGADELKDTKPTKPISGTSPQDTGGGGNTSSVGKTGQAGKA
ncbi:COG4695 Phage-related protein [uncultured Caudovirales phage]|uniref:COG4695 Phage-related protein n=1 Tax=uncultured Caudovirales phage TaxID=2100421 RepID=A0A6J7WXA9_9CAUD|nr:COG4695 Phage-related protein [uncultured Caudovirales phage]